MKININAPWYRSPEFQHSPTRDIEIVTDLGDCEGCLYLHKNTDGDGYGFIQCQHPERMDLGLGTSIKNRCFHKP